VNKKLLILICVAAITSLLLPEVISLADVHIAPSGTLVGTTDKERYKASSTIKISVKNIGESDYNGRLKINLTQEARGYIVETQTVQIAIPKGRMKTIVWKSEKPVRSLTERWYFQFTFCDSNTGEYLGHSNNFIVTWL
jgi:hypothetical protein